MNRPLPGLGIVLLTLAMGLAACSSDTPSASAADSHKSEHDDERGHDEHGEEGPLDFAKIDPASASTHGILVAEAVAGSVPESISLTGRLIIDPRRIALVRARFPGPIRAIAKEVGDRVSKGDVLAQVESNESLTVYDVRSPINGVVLERMTNAGDVAGTEPIFRVGDLATLQAELKVFQTDQSRVQRGGDAIVRIGGQNVAGKVASLVPEIDGRTQAMLVRIELSPRGTINASPGQFVTGQILIGQREAQVAIPVDAVQRFEGREVVFVPEEDGFRARTIKVGRRSIDQVEITDGLAPGERYVSSGAFLVKAEIGKSLAAHDD